jgi:MiaB-like tRNA modifying enzyme
MTAARAYIETYGCAFNAADGEALAGVLQAGGFELVDDPENADVVILNTCTVKDRTTLNFEKRFGRFKAAAQSGDGPALVVAGCIPKANPRGGRVGNLLDGVAALGPDTIDRAAEIARAAIAGRPLRHVRAARRLDGLNRPHLPARRRNPAVEILPIAAGCLSACTFCQTRLARGRLQSFRPGDLIDRARRAIGEGVSELWVTSQDTGAYGRDSGHSLAALLERICALPGRFRVRLGMSSPIWIREDLEPIMAALAHPKMFKFLHLPLQSGSDAVLEAMQRGNTVAQFEAVCEGFAARFPEGSLLTDLIVGYPAETDADFESTLALIRRVRPDGVNRSKFSARPGTAAARLTPLPRQIVNERSRRLFEAARRIAAERNRPFVGRRERVLTCETKPNGTTLAHNDAYRPVVLEGHWTPGLRLTAHYAGAAEHHLKGIVTPPPSQRTARDEPSEADFSLLSASESL